MLTVSEALALAFQSYQAGQLDQAEFICQQILQQQPHCAEALQLLGVMAHQVGKLPEAIFYYQQIVTLRPEQADAYYSLGAALHQQGQLEAAIQHYQQAITLQPNYAHAYYDLGNALYQQGQLEAAIQHYQQAITLNPNDAEAHGNLANALLEQGQLDAAIIHYQQSLALRPNAPGIYYNLGNALKQQGQLDAAITQYRWAVALNPNYADGHLQLGMALYQQGHQLEEAITCCEQAIVLKPNAAAYCNLGNALLKQGKQEEALRQYQQALILEPQHSDAYVGLGCALIHQYQFEAATVYFQQAITLAPDSPEAYQNLGVALMNQNQVDEAIEAFQKALELKPDFIEAYWQLQLILPIFYDNQNQIPIWRQRFCLGLNKLIQQTALDTFIGKQQALKGLERSAITFYLGYQGLKDRGLQRKYGNFVHKIVAANYPQWASPLPKLLLSKTDKIRIGYLSAHLRHHTVAKLTFGWLKNCDKKSFEVYSYHIGQIADFKTEEFRSCSDHFYHVYSSLEAICQQVLADKLHILIFTDIGMDTRITEIAGLRLAAWQCATWMHPITTGLPTIDYYLSSDLMEPQNAQSHYCEKLVCLPNISICYEKPVIPEPKKTRSDFHFREDAIVYLSCQSLFKYLPRFDYIFAKIAQRVPQAQFAFISGPGTAISAKFEARFRRAFVNCNLNSEDYCVFLPKQSQDDYFNLNSVSDIFLDTFSWSGGNTTLEAIACGLPVVTCPGEFMRSRHSYGILQMMGVTETIAQDEAEYVEIAVRLGLEPEWRQHIVQKIYQRHSWLYDDRTCVTALESFYKSLVQD
ncbi:MAG: tetratricopeptide repeat protein [Chroococcidiopsidaceae cyanobacterium CP_BM_RX_35]|nr:tetratricopeptide repeat protein [Chroococcidiopsidaceae cyanobacterium CP_BM_RX_35]